ncbi:MAG TPA: FAD-dependent oxidoreductase [Bacilli bacterium]|nr:FAD-dependent oxidoreductase [Bacilli bacterium]
MKREGESTASVGAGGADKHETRAVDVVIVGGGPAGISAAIWCKRLGLSHLLVEAELELGGQLFAIHNPVIDYPGVRAENGREVQALFAEHVCELECDVLRAAEVLKIDVLQKKIVVRHLGSRSIPSPVFADSLGSYYPSTVDLHYKGLILATGSSERRLNVAGEREMIERGEVYSASRDSDRFAGKRVAVVGGGDRAFEGALLLAERGAEVFLIHRSDRFRAREEFVEPVLAHERIHLLPFATVEEVIGTESVSSIRVKKLQDGGRVTSLDVTALFVRIGVEPNSHLVRGQVETDADGYLLTNEVGQTRVPGVFAVGDVCTRPLSSSIASAVGQGMMAAKHLSLYLEQKGEAL